MQLEIYIETEGKYFTTFEEDNKHSRLLLDMLYLSLAISSMFTMPYTLTPVHVVLYLNQDTSPSLCHACLNPTFFMIAYTYDRLWLKCSSLAINGLRNQQAKHET